MSAVGPHQLFPRASSLTQISPCLPCGHQPAGLSVGFSFFSPPLQGDVKRPGLVHVLGRGSNLSDLKPEHSLPWGQHFTTVCSGNHRDAVCQGVSGHVHGLKESGPHKTTFTSDSASGGFSHKHLGFSSV